MKNLLLILLCLFCVSIVSAQTYNCDLQTVVPTMLKNLVEGLKAGKNKVESATYIGTVGKNCPTFVSRDILDALFIALESDPDSAVKEAAGRALLAIGNEPAIAMLRGAFKNSNPATRLAVLRVFLYEKKLDRLLILAAMKDPDPEIRMVIASACLMCSADDKELLNALADLADGDPDPGVRREAIRTLIVLEVEQEDDGLSTPAVIPKEIKECLEAIASSKDKRIKQAAVDKLIAMGKAAVQPAIWELLDITANEDPDARYYTAMALKGLGDKTAICGLKSGIYYEEVPHVRGMMEDALKHLQSLPD